MKPIKEEDRIFGENIKREREKAGYTQERFSEMIDMTPNNLSAVERGVASVSLKMLRRNCSVLKVSADELLYETQEKSDVATLTQKLERLNTKQLQIAEEMFSTLLEAFALRKE